MSKEEVFSLYNKLNILLSKERDALQNGDIEGAFDVLNEENNITKKIESIPKESYILTEKDRKELATLIKVCMKKREYNERLLNSLKESLKEKILKLEEGKKVIKSYYGRGIVSPKFIDKTR